jgi:hypothetical protein
MISISFACGGYDEREYRNRVSHVGQTSRSPRFSSKFASRSKVPSGPRLGGTRVWQPGDVLSWV